MNDPDDFLTRWSRRKRAAAEHQAPTPAVEQGDTDAGPVEKRIDEQRADETVGRKLPATSVVDDAKESVFDLSKLPPIETITAETDIRAFLAPGVPAELRLAALRRAWAADPKVRDFVGLADYDFDYNTPGAIAGFGPLELNDDLRRELVRMAGVWPTEPDIEREQASSEQPAQSAAAASDLKTPPLTTESVAAGRADAPSVHPGGDQDEVIANEATTQRNKESVAPQQEQQPRENLQTLAKRGHGGALPH
jgi:hypothetical protein